MANSYEKYAIRDRIPDAKKAVLLVIDMQEYFRGMAEPILPAIQRSIDLARAARIPVIFTQHSHNGPSEYGMLYEWWDGNLIMAGSPEAELMPEVPKLESDKLVPKHTYSGFYNTDLARHLKETGKTEVIITGVMTNLCCETTAREAFIRGFRVFVSSDATATINEDLHVSSLKSLAYGFAYLVNVNSLAAMSK
jgi:nicotinamidase-related amidase